MATAPDAPAGSPGPDAPPAAGTDEALAGLHDVLTGALVAVDFDGTLAPIVRDPSTSRPVPGALAALQALTAAGARIAVITGREARVVTDLGDLTQVPGVVVQGVYGAQTLRDGELVVDPTPPAMVAARAEVADVLAAAGADPEVWVEDKDVSFVVHARLAADPDAATTAITPAVTDLVERHGLELHPGKQVLEVRVPGTDKGVALGRLLDELDPPGLLWAGDDLGDLPAFARLARWRADTGRPAVGVAVRPSASPDPLGGTQDDVLDPRLDEAADVVVDGPAAFVELLGRLLGGDAR